ncbi:unnamed protein product [Acanthoscelides obtectus]|uniref:Uncharacterized protein n=1 Tax=Acanthoscelides obtectus TaxID=200917 RepID=A0A9P0JTX1_ACAOB|nr:unnamed protein product [Acanthoscelides obtectus]CAK1621840.1 hypothetical protein AOBTE_LOCUS1163 [Acanthoscelides obtectus]
MYRQCTKKCEKMPNKYTRKTDRGTASVEIYDLAFGELRLRDILRRKRLIKQTQKAKLRLCVIPFRLFLQKRNRIY